MGKRPTAFTGRNRRKKEPAKGPLARNFLREWRLDRKLTQEELADRIGMSHPSIQRLENSKQGLSLEVLEKLAVALRTTRTSILDRKPNEDD